MSDSTKKFHLGLCLAGAVTAGAYTAGVLDYLFETLELWQNRKDANRKARKNNLTPPFPETPDHDVVIDVITGASAGGMCAAISTAMLVEGINADDLSNKKSKLYKVWVELADDEQSDTLHKMLEVDDLKKDGFVSLLNTKIISDLAEKALQTIKNERMPSYVDPNLDVVFTIANLRGKHFAIAFKGDGTNKNFKMTLHQDFMHFKLNRKSTKEDDFLSLSFSKVEEIQLLRQSAVATGAFPLGLRAQSLERPFSYYTNKTNDFLGLSQLKDRGFAITELEEIPENYSSLNVDGGVFDNEPFGKTQQILNKKAEKSIDQDLTYDKSNRAILMIDPFPSVVEEKLYEEKPKIVDLIPQIIKALRSQSSFKKNDLIDSLSEDNYTKFMVFPSKSGETEPLCCASLGAFGGFLHKDFRLHDYQLGRRNAQRFLQNHFVIPYGNDKKGDSPIHSGWANTHFDTEEGFLPIIPDYHTLEETRPKLESGYPLSSLKDLKIAIGKRVAAILEELGRDLTNPNSTDESEVVKNWFGEKKKGGILHWPKAQISRFITSQVRKNLQQKIVDKIIKVILVDLEKAELLDKSKN